MRRTLIRGWLRIGWHSDGMSLDRYLQLTWVERFLLHEELGDMIERTDPDLDRPKKGRK